MDNTSSLPDEESRFSLKVVDSFIILCALTNIIMNCLILYGLLKTKLFRPVYIVLIHISIFEIIGQISCPTLFRLFLDIDDFYKDFRNHAIFSSIYFITLYLVAMIMFVLLFRIHLSCVDKNFIWVLVTYWVFAIIVSVLVFFIYNSLLFGILAPYLIILAVLLVYLHVHQIRTTLKFSEYSGVDYQVSLLIVLTFISSRLIAMLLFALGEITFGLVPILGDYYFLGILQLVSIANFLVIMKFEEGFYNNIRYIFRKRRFADSNFRQLQEEHGLPE